ncbi:DNA cytosine methyltransferase [Paenibacillus sp. TC-CSREp1]|uniref:DNA cytosine methyltransferase n=1 Tax=Paenibacillus sp. TC-CSREp1 TaxID=3410089 RepID=UPI003CFA8A7B
MNYLDLFSGAGGLSEGFTNAGFNGIAHIEIDENACKTLKTRNVYHYLNEIGNIDLYNKYLLKQINAEELYSSVPKYITENILQYEINESNLESIYDDISECMSINNASEIDLIIGGPPCQAYSIIGRARDSNGMKNDIRNYLYILYIEFLKKYKPKVFIFENVVGLFSAHEGKLYQDLAIRIQESGYTFEAKILDSFDFGVMQKRKRVIIIGWRNDYSFNYPIIEKVEFKENIFDLFSDLPSLKPGEQKNGAVYIKNANSYLINSGIRNLEDTILTWHNSRSHISRDLEIYQTAQEYWYKNKIRLKYDMLPPHLQSQNNLKSFLDRYKVVAGDLQYSHTMVAHISRDGHYYIHPDINQIRSISVRESARIQSFPDNYYFEGSRTSAFKQIGNAVPPLMAKILAKKIYENMK